MFLKRALFLVFTQMAFSAESFQAICKKDFKNVCQRAREGVVNVGKKTNKFFHNNPFVAAGIVGANVAIASIAATMVIFDQKRPSSASQSSISNSSSSSSQQRTRCDGTAQTDQPVLAVAVSSRPSARLSRGVLPPSTDAQQSEQGVAERASTTPPPPQPPAPALPSAVARAESSGSSETSYGGRSDARVCEGGCAISSGTPSRSPAVIPDPFAPRRSISRPGGGANVLGRSTAVSWTSVRRDVSQVPQGFGVQVPGLTLGAALLGAAVSPARTEVAFSPRPHAGTPGRPYAPNGDVRLSALRVGPNELEQRLASVEDAIRNLPDQIAALVVAQLSGLVRAIAATQARQDDQFPDQASRLSGSPAPRRGGSGSLGHATQPNGHSQTVDLDSAH